MPHATAWHFALSEPQMGWPCYITAPARIRPRGRPGNCGGAQPYPGDSDCRCRLKGRTHQSVLEGSRGTPQGPLSAAAGGVGSGRSGPSGWVGEGWGGTGFTDPRVLTSSPIEIHDPALRAVTGQAKFFSITSAPTPPHPTPRPPARRLSR